MIVVADSSPIRYLIVIEAVDILPQIYGRVLIPTAVLHELSNRSSPDVVRSWLSAPPNWLSVREVRSSPPPALNNLDRGEQQAILLALEQLEPTTVLVDDGMGRLAARALRTQVTGTIGVLEEAGRLGLIDLEPALARLQQTNFRISQQVIDLVLERFRLASR